MQNVFTKKWVWLPVILFALTLLALAPVGAHAKVVATGDTVYLGVDEVVDDNYIATGGTVEVAGTVNGDVYAAAGTVMITGTVGGDVIVGGGTVTVTGDVMGSVRVGAGTVDISGTVGKNLTVFGGTVRVGSDTTVGWSVLAYGGVVDLRGTVHGNADLGGGAVTMGATVNGNLSIDAGGSDTQITLLSTMSVGKDFSYTYATALTVDSAKVSGDVVYTEYMEKKSSYWAAKSMRYMLAKAVLGFLATMVLGLVLIAVGKNRIGEVTKSMRHEAGINMLWGVLYVLVAIVAGILLLFTVVGIKLAVFNFLLLGMMTLFSCVLISIAVGQQVKKWLNIKAESMTLSLLVGALLSYVVMLIPFVGWFIALLAGAWAIGAMVRHKWAWLHEGVAQPAKKK